jgi:hypothetical protein
MRRVLVFLVALVCVSACQLFSPGGNLDGTWRWEYNRNPSGSSITLSLTTAGTNVTGAGNICGVGPACSPGPVTITGQQTLNNFDLTIRDQNAFMATYSGQLIHGNELKGSWRHGADSGSVVFFRN